MTTHRPNVAIYQEFKTVSFTPATPTLDVLVVGPCYQILDYLDDKDDCYADADYGTYEENNPFTTPPAVLVTDAPSIEAGAKLDADSVNVFFDEARAILAEHSGAPDDAYYRLNDNLFQANAGVPGAIGVHFGSEEVAAGDRLIVQPAAGVDDYKMTIKELAYTFSGVGFTFVTAGVTSGDSVVISADAAPTPRNGTYTVKRVVSELALEVEDDDGLLGTIALCNFKVLGSGGTVKVDAIGVAVTDACYLRTTSDFDANSLAASPILWRVERKFDDYKLDATQFSVDTNNDSITINSAIQVGLSTTLLNKDVTYAKIYIEYRALRQTLQQINEVSQDTAAMELLLGKLDARNPLHVGAYIAALNTLTTVKVFGLKSDDIAGYMDFVSKISNERKVYAVVPLTYNTTVLGFLNTMAMTLADPDYVLSSGIRQKFRAVLGAVDLPVYRYIINPTNSATTLQKTSTKPLSKGRRNLVFDNVAGLIVAPAFITVNGVIPGDKIEFMANSVVYNYTVAHVRADDTIEVDPDEGAQLPPGTLWPVVSPVLVADGDYLNITDATGLVLRFSSGLYNTMAGDTFDITTDYYDDLYLVLQVPSAHFITDGVLPGDILQMPSNPSINDFTTPTSWVVDDVLSETRLQVVNAGNDTSTVENELPHEGYRGGGSSILPGTLYMRVIRNFTKAQQVTELLATAHSFSSRRLVLAFPDLVDVAGLKDGSLDRMGGTDPIDALSQPGYYLACAIGGQTAGQPSQQGFTFLGINGISRIYGSNDYFSEEQLTELSNGGLYVFTQDSLAALPSTIHEVTTDVSTLEFSEYMILKNFDYIAWTFLDVLLAFIGRWNVTQETIQFIGQAEQAVIGTLKSARKIKIGAPLIDAKIISNEISTISSDRVESFIEIEMPMVLNIIGCHLVA